MLNHQDSTCIAIDIQVYYLYCNWHSSLSLPLNSYNWIIRKSSFVNKDLKSNSVNYGIELVPMTNLLSGLSLAAYVKGALR